MPILAESVDALVAVDTHLDTHTAGVLNPMGAVLAEVCAPTTPAGLAALPAFAADNATRAAAGPGRGHPERRRGQPVPWRRTITRRL